MQDVMIFGEGHLGTLLQVEEGADSIITSSKGRLSDKGGSDRYSFESQAGFKFNVGVIYHESGSYLIGVRNDPPTNKEIDDAIKRYRPRPIR